MKIFLSNSGKVQQLEAESSASSSDTSTSTPLTRTKPHHIQHPKSFRRTPKPTEGTGQNFSSQDHHFTDTLRDMGMSQPTFSSDIEWAKCAGLAVSAIHEIMAATAVNADEIEIPVSELAPKEKPQADEEPKKHVPAETNTKVPEPEEHTLAEPPNREPETTHPEPKEATAKDENKSSKNESDAAPASGDDAGSEDSTDESASGSGDDNSEENTDDTGSSSGSGDDAASGDKETSGSDDEAAEENSSDDTASGSGDDTEGSNKTDDKSKDNKAVEKTDKTDPDKKSDKGDGDKKPDAKSEPKASKETPSEGKFFKSSKEESKSRAAKSLLMRASIPERTPFRVGKDCLEFSIKGTFIGRIHLDEVLSFKCFENLADFASQLRRSGFIELPPEKPKASNEVPAQTDSQKPVVELLPPEKDVGHGQNDL